MIRQLLLVTVLALSTKIDAFTPQTHHVNFRGVLFNNHQSTILFESPNNENQNESGSNEEADRLREKAELRNRLRKMRETLRDTPRDPTPAVDPAYLKKCEDKAFLLSKSEKTHGEHCFRRRKYPEMYSEAKMKIESKYGAKIGSGTTHHYLEAAGFPDAEPLGAMSLIQSESLQKWKWERTAYPEYAAATKYGALILAVKPKFFQRWAVSCLCRKEVEGIPTGRLFAYIEHQEDDEGGRQGYIVHIDTQNREGATTVANGKGYVLWYSGSYYRGDIKNNKMHGQGASMYANLDVYYGEYKDDKRHGQGTYKYSAGGDVYRGEWKDDKRHGQGTYTYHDGDVYKGEYKDDNIILGQGTYTCSGDVVKLLWKDVRDAGQGTN